MTTKSCRNCYEPDCDKLGQDMLACEHFVRADDIEVEPPDESPDLPGMILAECVDDIAKLREEFDGFRAGIEGAIAASVKALAGEGL